MYIGNSPASVGNYQVVDDISSTFNGVLTSFALTVSSLAINPAKSGQILVSINGVLQEPDDTGTEGFKVSGSNIVFSSAPATGSTFWAVFQGQNVDVGTPSNATVGLTQLSATGTASSATFLAGDNTWKTVDALPTQVTHAGKYLGTDGTTASWNTLDTDANSTTKGLYEHANTIAANYTIATGNNALTAGPITINTGVSVTVPTGSTWVVA